MCGAAPCECPADVTLFFTENVYIGKYKTVSSAGLPSGGGRGPTPAHDDRGTDARAPESAVTIPLALARRSAKTEKKNESGDRKAFRHPRTRH